MGASALKATKREGFSSRRVFMLPPSVLLLVWAIWRFPSIAFDNGGGAGFVIPHLSPC